MADEAQPTPFDLALQELADHLANAPIARRTLDRPTVGAGQYGLPSMPPLPRRQTEVRSANRPEADWIINKTGISPDAGPALNALAGVGEGVAMQIPRAGSAVGDAMIDPSIPNLTNAGVQTALAVARPAAALKVLGAGYAGAAAKDLGLLDPTQAEAGTPLTRAQRREMEMEKQRQERQAEIDRRAAETNAALKIKEKDAEAERQIKTQAQVQDRAEHDRQVANADQLAAKAIGRDRRFSDTAVGQVYDKTGGLAPALMGLFGAKLSRLATGPGATTTGQIIKDYALPLTTGTVTGAITANLPLAYNALATEPDNPKRRMYEALAENLPAGDPRRQEATERLQDKVALPEANPIRSAASAEFYDPEKLKERLIMGGVEGFGGGLFGTDLVRALGRGATAIGNRWRGPTGAQPTGVATDAPLAGTLVETNALSRPATAALESSAGTPPALGGGAPNGLAGPAQRQLPAPEASPNPRPTYKGTPLPEGVDLDVNGVPYNVHTGHKVNQQLLTPRKK